MRKFGSGTMPREMSGEEAVLCLLRGLSPTTVTCDDLAAWSGLARPAMAVRALRRKGWKIVTDKRNGGYRLPSWCCYSWSLSYACMATEGEIDAIP